MINVCVIIVGLLLAFHYSLADSDYYWRDYNGNVPEDALPGGLINNTNTYIGTIPIFKGKISAMIFPKDLNGYGAFGGSVFAKSNRVKILVSPHHDRFNWVTEIPSSCSLVQGTDFSLSEMNYIGRGMYEGQLHTGRTTKEHSLLYFPWLAPIMRVERIDNYERLVFCSTAGYYWRPYRGTIPEDAIPGGFINNTDTYIGMIPYGRGQISAMIYPKDLNGYSVFGDRVIVKSESVEILCSPNHDKLHWVAEIPSSCSLVKGNYVSRSPIEYIGRGMYEGQLHTGRTTRDYPLLYFPWLAPIKRAATMDDFKRLVYCSTAGYYWRRYNGIVPEDALPAGLINNKNTYIGMIPAGKGNISAMIFPNDLNGYGITSNLVHVNSDRVEILCSPHHERFKWVTEIPPSCSLVKGNHVSISPIDYIGRGMYEGQLYTGRTTRNHPVLYFPILTPTMRVATINNNFERLVFC